ncbi:MAG TPA: efflux RND transporter periplasmic adaptor subunit [Verrucomicrobiae bacterium]|jgi:multidrug efflux pump subunit AcrA (membrane-fusion protein)|nr:efflux RND transporter periplasmic adaptor subunit [Verrucomicrobiae bacterium]
MNTRILLIVIAVVLAAMGAIVNGTSAGESNTTEGKTLYTCGMHPQVIQDHPGNCPICGMKLTPIRSGAGMDTNAASSSAIAVDAATRQSMNLRTAVVQSGPLRKIIRTVGTIDYNETAEADVTTKFRGWIETLNVDATGQLVHRGEPMFEIYSPELYSAEAEYLLAIKGFFTNDPGAAELRETAANKLKFFDVPNAEIADLAKNGVPRKTLPVDAPASGFVIEKNIVQGQMVDAGMRLYRIADLGIVWVLAEIYEQDLPFVQLGQEAVVKVSAFPDREFRGRVTFIYPTMDEKTRTERVRLEFENPGYFLKPGMFVSAQIQVELAGSAVLVPDSAILRSGEKNTVFVALDGGKFEARDVALGVEGADDLVQVLSGLNAGERIVTSGQFLLDSESQLREAIEKMRGSTPAGNTEMTVASSMTNSTKETVGATPTTEPETVYVCPMPEHVSIVYNHPGNCPICGMALVPVTASALKNIQPGGKVLYYTCPMPGHGSVHEDKPGKCPLCGMTLIPVMSKSEASATAAKPAQKYFCPMHPEVISDEPGKCPKCGMDLVPLVK